MASIETVYQVIDENGDGDYIEVGPSPDFPGNVRLHTPDLCVAFFGAVSIDMDREFMHKLGEALIRAAETEEHMTRAA